MVWRTRRHFIASGTAMLAMPALAQTDVNEGTTTEVESEVSNLSLIHI